MPTPNHVRPQGHTCAETVCQHLQEQAAAHIDRFINLWVEVRERLLPLAVWAMRDEAVASNMGPVPVLLSSATPPNPHSTPPHPTPPHPTLREKGRVSEVLPAP